MADEVTAPNPVEKPKKKKKYGFLIGTIITVVLLATVYFVGGTVLGYYGITYFMQLRNTKESDLTTFYNKVFYTRKDYANLNTRTEVTFKVGDFNAQGYLYECPSPKGVVVASHDIVNQSDGNISQVYNYFYEHGYDVFAFDQLGCGRSGGDGLMSMYQSKLTTIEAINAVKNTPSLAGLDIVLFGHSFGGYGAVAASGEEGVKAVASLGAFNKARDMLYDYAITNISEWLKLLTPDYDLALNFLNKDGYYACISDVVAAKHETVKYYIAHGKDDPSVTFGGTSLYHALDGKNYTNVTLDALEGLKHDNLWNTADAASYVADTITNYEKVKAENGGEVPQDIYNQLLNDVDKDRSSALNTTLLDAILAMYDSAVGA